MLKVISILGLVVMIGALIGLYKIGVLFTAHPIAIALQVIAIALMVWARVTFGRRSFHAAANPTAGGLVTTGPYGIIRHPIYTAACLFGWGSIVVHWSLVSVALGILLLLGALMRMLCEEQLVKQKYPEYVDYAKVTKRMVPYVF
ncbi:MAG TPA: isoprenylcysteine carboxylmethyltransferase family protein [Pyrinomonadaceae bacterium]|nr:isoprenylcysteine carboxylmethyltransferase family protein [Pyrinomonadaceae bacterium]